MTSSAHSPFKIGYARVSTTNQDEALQIDALQQAQVDRVFIDRASGSVQDRPGLTSALECARPGDSLVVWRLDRLGRSLRHLIDVVRDLEQRGVALVSLTEQIDTSTPSGRLVFHVFGALARFERELCADRWLLTWRRAGHPGCCSPALPKGQRKVRVRRRGQSSERVRRFPDLLNE